MIIDRLQKGHFGNEEEKVISYIKSGLCCSVFGIPGYGITYFPMYIERILKEEGLNFNVIHINLELNENPVNNLKEQISELLQKKNVFENDLNKYLSKNKILIILAEVTDFNFEKLFTLLKNYHSLNPSNFLVLTVGSYKLYKYLDKFVKLGRNIFTPQVQILPFDKMRARKIFEYNNLEYNWDISEDLFEKIFELSGGNPALLKNICLAISERGESILENPTKLIKQQPLNMRISQIVECITQTNREEQLELELINKDNKFFAKIIEYYLDVDIIEEIDILFPLLNFKEKRILTILLRNRGKVVSKDKISLLLGQDVESYSEWAIYKAIERLRKKIKDKIKIEIIKGKGWMIV